MAKAKGETVKKMITAAVTKGLDSVMAMAKALASTGLITQQEAVDTVNKAADDWAAAHN